MYTLWCTIYICIHFDFKCKNFPRVYFISLLWSHILLNYELYIIGMLALHQGGRIYMSSNQWCAYIVRDDGKRQWMVANHHGKDVVSPASFVFRAKVKLQVAYVHPRTYTCIKLTCRTTRRALLPLLLWVPNAAETHLNHNRLWEF